ncbi:RES family NAD+ phosphorylase [Litoribacter ruber]|uniref:RES family NAD+ phosphorylase n=1 Tax=Litoribacter ruber TaxID=702568 RepID=A0AAP2CLN9_9BACT|nr:RES family NAD+ phosphorylase [Litoribacter alkaliphilus]MBT0812785.1 RES family NAD+ phosphorylase [Litoribacter ruber]
MLVFRLASTKYSRDLSGTGSSLFGGRWNKKGSPVLYTGESREIALLEALVNIPPMVLPEMDMITLQIPSNSIIELKFSDLPPNWRDYPAPSVLAEITEEWIVSKDSLALKVPSAIIDTSHNYIINCAHKLHSKLKIKEVKAFKFDTRLRRG